MSTFLRGDCLGITLGHVLVTIAELRCRDARHDELGPEAPCEPSQDARTKARYKHFLSNAGSLEFAAPELRMLRFGLRELQEQLAPDRIRLGGSEPRVERGSVQLIAQVLTETRDVIGIHVRTSPLATHGGEISTPHSSTCSLPPGERRLQFRIEKRIE